MEAAVGFKTAKLHVTVHKDPFGLTVTDNAKHVIAQDLPGRPIEYHGTSFRVYMKSPADEHYFGLGDKPGPSIGAMKHLPIGIPTRSAGSNPPIRFTNRFPGSSPSTRAFARGFISTTRGVRASTSTRNIGTDIRLGQKQGRWIFTFSMVRSRRVLWRRGRGWWAQRRCRRCGRSAISNLAIATFPKQR